MSDVSAGKESLFDALDRERVAAALLRVAELWPEGLDAVPGSHEVAAKRDADTIRALAYFWQQASEADVDPDLLAVTEAALRERNARLRKIERLARGEVDV